MSTYLDNINFEVKGEYKTPCKHENSKIVNTREDFRYGIGFDMDVVVTKERYKCKDCGQTKTEQGIKFENK